MKQAEFKPIIFALKEQDGSTAVVDAKNKCFSDDEAVAHPRVRITLLNKDNISYHKDLLGANIEMDEACTLLGSVALPTKNDILDRKGALALIKKNPNKFAFSVVRQPKKEEDGSISRNADDHPIYFTNLYVKAA